MHSTCYVENPFIMMGLQFDCSRPSNLAAKTFTIDWRLQQWDGIPG